MKKSPLRKIFFYSLFLLCLCALIPVESSAKRRRLYKKKKWSLSVTSGYTLYKKSKGSQRELFSWADEEGQMHEFFSSLDISRNFGYYEIGAKIQNTGSAFVSPFFKWNINKNTAKASIIPSLTIGIVPAHTVGIWLRASLSLALNRYVSFTPFVGTYAWYKIKDDPKYEKGNFLINTGLSINLYY